MQQPKYISSISTDVVSVYTLQIETGKHRDFMTLEYRLVKIKESEKCKPRIAPNTKISGITKYLDNLPGISHSYEDNHREYCY